MSTKHIQKTIEELVTFITQESTKNSIGLSAAHYFWSKKKTWSPMNAEFDDIGDYVVFVVWAGKIFKNKQWTDFGKNQLSIWDRFKNSEGWYQTLVNCETPDIRNVLSYSIYDLQDAILGLYELVLLTEDAHLKDELNSLIGLINKVALLNRDQLPNQVFAQIPFALPWTSINSAVTGLIAEHLILTEDLGIPIRANQLAERLVKKQLSHSIYQNHSLFGQGYNSYIPFLSPYKTSKPMKETTNMLFAMLWRYEEYKEQVDTTLGKLLSFQTEDGGFRAVFNTKTGQLCDTQFNKTQNFALIDLFLEASIVSEKSLSKKYIAAAEKCAHFWLKFKNGTTNLIPDYIQLDGTIIFPIAKLDQSADFYSSLLRLYSITGKKRYLKEVQVGAKVLADSFGESAWWHRVVNINTANLADDIDAPESDQPVGRNLTKYVGGALRFYLSLYLVEHGQNMYSDRLLRMLSRDR